MPDRSAEQTGRAYFDAITARDNDAMASYWAPEGVDRIHGQAELRGPGEVRRWFGELMAAIPDLDFRAIDVVADADRCAVRWRLRGTFAGGPYNGIEATGASIDIQGIDLLSVRDGMIVGNDAYTDGLTFARQMGMLPPEGSGPDRGITAAFNARTRALRGLMVGEPEPVADGVWLVRGGAPTKGMNVYFIEDEGGGVTMFDAGIADMTRGLIAAGARLGGINRIVLGHAHGDHRGAAAGIDAPIHCHEAERTDAQGDGGEHTFDYAKLNPLMQRVYPKLLAHWDGGPLPVAGTLTEGDEVSGFRVVHTPGHAKGLISLFRDSDRLALVSDTFYTIDPQTLRKGGPRIPHPAFTPERDVARASLRKLAALEPAAAWPGHADPVVGDVRAQLEHAAATT